MTEEPSRPIVSVHFPKASGTALRFELMKAFGESSALLSYDCDPVDPANPLWFARDWFLRSRPVTIHPHRVVHGHFPIVQFDLLPSAFRIVMLREPVENLISIYFFWRAMFASPMKGHALYDLVRKERLSLLETAELPLMRWLMSRSYFGGYDMRRFNVIGSLERREEYFAAVSAGIGKPLHAGRRENVTPISEERGNVLNDTRLMARLRDLLRDDVRFYETHTQQPRRTWLSRLVFVPRASAAFGANAPGASAVFGTSAAGALRQDEQAARAHLAAGD